MKVVYYIYLIIQVVSRIDSSKYEVIVERSSNFLHLN